MEVKIYIEPLEQDVTFTAKVIRTNSIMATYPKYYLDEIGWEVENFTPEENFIIAKYFDEAVDQLFETIKTNA